MEKYSVLMSLYSKEKPNQLVLSIDSMINQSIPPDEIVIVEDGELTDELYKIVDTYTRNHPKLFTIVKNNQNLGLGLSLNNGLFAARNNLVARMDTDDISKNDRCEKQLKVFEINKELSIVGSWVDEFAENTDSILSTRKVPEKTDEIYKFSKRRSAFNHPAVMYKKASVLECGGYNDLKRNQDVDLFGRMMFAGYKAYNIQESLLLFRTNIELAKRRKSWVNTKSYLKVIRNFWKMGFSSFWDFFIVSIAQIVMFLMPARMQNWFYRIFLRK